MDDRKVATGQRTFQFLLGRLETILDDSTKPLSAYVSIPLR